MSGPLCVREESRSSHDTTLFILFFFFALLNYRITKASKQHNDVGSKLCGSFTHHVVWTISLRCDETGSTMRFVFFFFCSVALVHLFSVDDLHCESYMDGVSHKRKYEKHVKTQPFKLVAHCKSHDDGAVGAWIGDERWMSNYGYGLIWRFDGRPELPCDSKWCKE